MAGLRKLKDLVVHHDPRFYCAFPAVVDLPGGGALVHFRRARDTYHVIGSIGAGRSDLRRSSHVDSRSEIAALTLGPDLIPQGPPMGLPVDPEAGDQDANLVRLRSGRLLSAGFRWYPLSPFLAREAAATWGASVYGHPDKDGSLFLFWGSYARHSDDGGTTWSPRVDLPAIPGMPPIVPTHRPFLGGATRGRMAELGDGTILLPTYAHLPGQGQPGALALASRDGGESWQFLSHIALSGTDGPGYTETALHAAGQRVIAFMRTMDEADRIATAISTDGGRTWGHPRLTEVIGHPCDIVPLQDGRAVLVYGYRHAPYGIRARLLEDPFADPATAPEFVVRDDGPGPDLGYPWGCQLADGRVLLVYYFADADGARHIAGSILGVG
ncbi:MAG TPA: sialidase family protein [Azospirillaceae bacterium]|nr:sialidase family protein [Azospirillaceae bacterium]